MAIAKQDLFMGLDAKLFKTFGEMWLELYSAAHANGFLSPRWAVCSANRILG